MAECNTMTETDVMSHLKTKALSKDPALKSRRRKSGQILGSQRPVSTRCCGNAGSVWSLIHEVSRGNTASVSGYNVGRYVEQSFLSYGG